MTALRNSFHLHFEWIDHSEGVIGYGSNVVQNKIYFPRTRHNFLGPPCDVIRKDCEAAIAWFPKDSSEYLILRRRLYTVVQFAVKWSQDVESLALPRLHTSGPPLNQPLSTSDIFAVRQTTFLEIQVSRFLEESKKNIHACWDLISRIFLRISLAKNVNRKQRRWG